MTPSYLRSDPRARASMPPSLSLPGSVERVFLMRFRGRCWGPIRGFRGRRGAALLLALLVIVALSLAGVGAMRRSANGALSAAQDRFDEQSRWLARDAETLALRWLERLDRSRDPLVGDGVHEIMSVKRDGVAVRIGAIDLSGLLRVDLLGSFAATGLPEPIRSMRLEPRPADALPWLYEELAERAHAGVRAFPDRTWNNGDGLPAPAVALWVTARGSGAVNVHTAPQELLRAILRGGGRGGDMNAAQEALLARSRGLPVPQDALARLSVRPTEPSGRAREPGLTSVSDHFGFLVEISERGRSARWWLVAERTSRPHETHREVSAFGAALSEERRGWAIVEARRIAP